jgi:hypothetical protein
MTRIFRVATGVRRDPAVGEWLREGHPELCKIAREWFTHIRRCGDDVLELIHDGCPVACVEDAPFAYVDSCTGHVNVGFYYGALLADPAGLLEGSGKWMRHVKLRPGQSVDDVALRGLIDAAYAEIKARLNAERLSRKVG